jgi:hypothetical protein
MNTLYPTAKQQPKSTPATSPRLLKSLCLRLGIAGLVLGTGPLLLAVATEHRTGDSNPNPVGFGILVMFTFRLSIILIFVGVVVTLIGKIRFARSQPQSQPQGK